MSTEIAIQDPDNVLSLAEPNEWGDVDRGFVGEAPPSAAPVVPRFTFNAKDGQGFYDELTETTFGVGQVLRTVWLAWTESRAFWEQPFGTPNAPKEPTCRSTNMLVPDDASIKKQSTHCATCPHKEWGENNEAPRCNLRVNAMLYLPESKRIVRTAFGGLALKYVQRYLGGFETRLPYRPPMAFVTEILVDKEETNNGVFLVPKFKIANEITRAEAAPLIALRNELQKQWEALAAQDAADHHDDAKGAGPDPFAGETPFKDIPTPSDADIIDVESVEDAAAVLGRQATLDDEEPF